MAASPDIISGLLSDPNTAPYLGAAMGLLGSSGASRLPVTMGAAMGNALGGSQQYSQQVLQNAMARLQLGYKNWLLDRIQANQQQPTQSLHDLSQGTPTSATPAQKQLNDLNTSNSTSSAANPASLGNLLLSGDPGSALQMPASRTTLPQSSQDSSDQGNGLFPGMSPTEKLVMESALWSDPGRLAATMYSNDPSIAGNVAMARSTGHNLANQQVVLSPEEAARMGLAPLPPGMSYQYNVGSHQVSTVGQPTTKQLQAYTAQGYPVKVPATITGTGGVQIVPGASNLFSSIPGGLGIGGGAAPPSRVVPSASLSGSGARGASSVAQSIATNNAPFPPKLVGTPRGDVLLHQILQLNPEWNMQQYAVAQKTLTAFTSGAEGQSVRRFGAATQHLQVLGNLANALANGDTRAINAARNAVRTQFGSAARTNFDGAKQLVANEVQKAVAGVPGGEAERQSLMNAISSASSPQQLAGIIATFEKLMTGQLNALGQQYKSGTQRGDFSQRFLTPAVRKIYESYGGTPSPTPAALKYMHEHANDPAIVAQFVDKYGTLPGQ